jgi:hypothetical protein
MSDAIELPLDDDTHLIDPPIVDMLYLDAQKGAYVVTFIPDDNVSPNEKEVVRIAADSEDGRRIKLRLTQLSKAIGSQAVTRLFHKGGGNFGFKLADGSTFELADAASSSALSRQVHVELQDLGMISQISFREKQLAAAHA